jgi:hypothetical protein
LRDALAAREEADSAASQRWAAVLSRRLRALHERLGDASSLAAHAGADARTQRALVAALRQRAAVLEVQARRARDELATARWLIVRLDETFRED